MQKEKGKGSSGKTGNKPISMTKLRSGGAVLSLLQAVIAALLIYLLNGTGMIPWKYIMTAFAVLACMVLVVILMINIRNRRVRIAGIVLSALMIIVQLVGCNYLYRTMNLLKSSESSYKTDYLDVVVRSDDAAQEIADTSGYQIGIVDDLSKDEKDILLETLRREMKEKSTENIEYKTYSSALEAAQALMDKEVDAAVYRES